MPEHGNADRGRRQRDRRVARHLAAEHATPGDAGRVGKVAVTGGTVEARHFTLRGDADLDTFHDMTPSWVGLRFTAKDGSEIRYIRA